ncbi:hypothetical protein E8E13_004387 [Curvularia kusanoi]|uniref:Uncharacterized protein n=1 Tax=Curvularia kusanoi TaxID=90978 RepID=A0A9P4T5Z3_CURKU|nr:hypothetical protein E8E13_004387 [Curvularia kusanoi]
MNPATQKALDALQNSMVQSRHDAVDEIKEFFEDCIRDIAFELSDKYFVLDRQTNRPVELTWRDLMSNVQGSEWWEFGMIARLKYDEDFNLDRMHTIVGLEYDIPDVHGIYEEFRGGYTADGEDNGDSDEANKMEAMQIDTATSNVRSSRGRQGLRRAWPEKPDKTDKPAKHRTQSPAAAATVPILRDQCFNEIGDLNSSIAKQQILLRQAMRHLRTIPHETVLGAQSRTLVRRALRRCWKEVGNYLRIFGLLKKYWEGHSKTAQ